MRVKMLKLMCSPQHGNHHPGDVVDLPDQEAQARIARGECVPVDEPPRGLVDRLRGRTSGKAKPLEKMTIDELKSYAADNDIELGDLVKKPEILAAIRAAEIDDG